MKFHSFIEEGPGWETLGGETRFANPHVAVVQARVRTPARPDGADWTVVHRKAASVVVPQTSGGKYVLVRQERIPVRATLWEFPAGQLEPDDSAEATALRELEEETGYKLPKGGGLQSLGHFFPSAGVMDEISHLFLARPVVRGDEGPRPDENEAICECGEFTADALRAMIAGGEIRDANTLAAFARMAAAGLI